MKHFYYDNKGNVLRAEEEPDIDPDPIPPRAPTDLELTQQDITDLQLSDITQGQTITDLELQLLEVQAHV